jgi:hypothetical protein
MEPIPILTFWHARCPPALLVMSQISPNFRAWPTMPAPGVCWRISTNDYIPGDTTMWTCTAYIVCNAFVVTTITLMEHAAREIWGNLPAMTTGLRAVGAVLGIAASIRALCSRREDRP